MQLALKLHYCCTYNGPKSLRSIVFRFVIIEADRCPTAFLQSRMLTDLRSANWSTFNNLTACYLTTAYFLRLGSSFLPTNKRVLITRRKITRCLFGRDLLSAEIWLNSRNYLLSFLGRFWCPLNCVWCRRH